MIATLLATVAIYGANPVPDRALAGMRGGILLANGTNVAIGIALETRVDGIVALRTQFSTETVGVQVFAGGPPPATDGVATPANSSPGLPDIRIIRNGIGTTIGMAPNVSIGQMRVSSAAAETVGTPLDLGGDRSVATAFGTVQAMRTATGTVVQLTGADLSIQQSIGQAIGTVVANTASNRVIDTVTAVNIDLRGMVIPAGMTSALEAVAIAVAARNR